MRKRMIRQIKVEKLEPVTGPLNPTMRSARPLGPRASLYVTSRNICEISTLLTRGLWRYADWKAWAVMTSESSWLNERHLWQLDYEDPDGREFAMLEEIARQASVIHLDSYHTWQFLGKMERELAGKKRMVVHHHAMRLREDPSIAQIEADAGYRVLVSTPDLLLHAPNATWLPSPIPLEELDHCYPRWEKEGPVVVGHCYTVAENKKTGVFDRIMGEATRRARNLTYMPWHGIRRRQSQWLLSQCDVYFATYLYGPGLATIEAMAFGIPALVGCTEDELRWQCKAVGVDHPDDLPWIYVTPATTADWIRTLVNEPELRRKWGAKGRAYVEKFHDVPRVVERLVDIYENTEPCRHLVKL